MKMHTVGEKKRKVENQEQFSPGRMSNKQRNECKCALCSVPYVRGTTEQQRVTSLLCCVCVRLLWPKADVCIFGNVVAL